MNFNLPEINLGFSALLIILVAWQILRVNRLSTVRKHFYSQGLKKNLETIVTEQDQAIAKINREIIDLNSQTEDLRKNNRKNLQKIGFVRFSPFGEAGNLSFAIAVLDDHNNGMVISSLHGREGTRVYAKDIKNAKSAAKLTDEETEALNQILKRESETNGKKR